MLWSFLLFDPSHFSYYTNTPLAASTNEWPFSLICCLLYGIVYIKTFRQYFNIWGVFQTPRQVLKKDLKIVSTVPVLPSNFVVLYQWNVQLFPCMTLFQNNSRLNSSNIITLRVILQLTLDQMIHCLYQIIGGIKVATLLFL